MEQCWLNFVFMSKPVKVALIRGQGGNVVNWRGLVMNSGRTTNGRIKQRDNRPQACA